MSDSQTHTVAAPHVQSDRPIPSLPVELIDNIISEAWSSDLTITKRTSLFTTLCLVDRRWLSIFIRVALVDVHIVSPAFADKYLFLLRERFSAESDNDYLLENASATANRLCRSLTFHVDDNPKRNTLAARMCSEPNYMEDAVSNVLYMIDTLSYTPNLHRVTLDYVDCHYDDVPDQLRLVPHVSEVEIRYSFSEEFSSLCACTRQSLYSRHAYPAWEMPNVRKLAITDAPTPLVNALVHSCPNLEVLDISDLCSLDNFTEELPESLRVLILQAMEGHGFGGKTTLKQFVARSCGDGSRKRRIILRAESPSN